MTESEFWQLIEKTRTDAGGDSTDAAAAQAELLVEELSDLEPDDIRDFDRFWARRHAEAFRWDLWGAAWLINGGCSDDGFDAFRDWLIGRGRRIYEAALASPDTLADVADGPVECEDLGFAALQAYEDVTGEELPPSGVRVPPEPAGTQWKEEELPQLFPKLVARFGH